MMRWRILLILWVALAGVIGCTRLEAAPAVVNATPKALTSEAMLDYRVVSTDGTEIGPVDGVVISTATGDTEYVTVFIEDIYNFGRGAAHGPQDHYMPIPWSRLTLDASQQQLVVDADASFVKDAPVLSQVPDTSVAGWDVAIAGYWTE